MKRLAKRIKCSVRCNKTNRQTQSENVDTSNFVDDISSPKAKRARYTYKHHRNNVKQSKSVQRISKSDNWDELQDDDDMSSTSNAGIKKKWYESDTMINIFQCLTCSELHYIGQVCKGWRSFLSEKPLCWKNYKNQFHMKSKTIRYINQYLEMKKSLPLSLFSKRFQYIENLSVQVGVDPLEQQSSYIPLIHSLTTFKNLKTASFKCFATNTEFCQTMLEYMQTILQQNQSCVECIAVEFRKDLNCQLLPSSNNNQKQELKIFDQLTHMIINRVWNLTVNWNQCINLKLLSINYHHLKQNEFETICKTCSKLELLELFMLEHEWLNETVFLQSISNLKHLRGLQLEYPRFEASCDFFEQLNECAPQLNILCLWWWTVRTSHANFIVENLKNLTDLALAFCEVDPFTIDKRIQQNKQTKIKRFGYQGAVVRSNQHLERLRTRADEISSIFEQYQGTQCQRYVPILTDTDSTSELTEIAV